MFKSCQIRVLRTAINKEDNVAAPMFLRQARRQFKFGLAKLLLGNKSTAPHFAFAGPGSARYLCQRIVESGHTRLLVVTDKPLRELGIADQALAGLRDTGVELHWYDGVLPDPTFAQVRAGAEIFQRERCTAVVAVGGGSSMDAAKIIAACLDPAIDPESWVGFNKAPEDAAPLYAIPTTAGTGSEATMGAVITRESDHSKNVISGAALLPRAVAIDATLMQGLPGPITAATGLDALTHGIEAFLSVWDRGTRAEAARMAIKGVFQWLPRVMAEPSDVEARQGMALAAYYGGVAINQVNVGNVHAIAHQLGARYSIPHGIANAMVLPHVLRLYGDLVAPQLAELADLVGIAQGSAWPAKAVAFIEAVDALRHDVGLPDRHSSIQMLDYSRIIEDALAEGDGYFSPRLLTEADVESVLRHISGASATA